MLFWKELNSTVSRVFLVSRRLYMSQQIPPHLNSLTREELIARIISLENGNGHSVNPVSTTFAPEESVEHKKPKKPRPFDFKKYSQRRIAFKVAYLGWDYSGFAAQDTQPDVVTIEGKIMDALMNCRLIESPQSCNFTKCGRTDKGVSGMGQVIALDVRSNFPQDSAEVSQPDKQIANVDTVTANEPLSSSSSIDDINRPKLPSEIPYLEILNHNLPRDIRILAWAPVSPNFNARFDCKSRTYKYLFARGNLDIQLMQKAASYFLGSHDFRNFAKLDPSKNITNYVRTILYIHIRPVSDVDFHAVAPGMEFYELQMQGTAFLWHQVRCMMSILFLVGQRLEAPEVVQELLDVKMTPARPEYQMASDLPLILYDCEFEGIEWEYSATAMATNKMEKGTFVQKLFRHAYSFWYEHMTKTLQLSMLLGLAGAMPVLTEQHEPMTLKEFNVRRLDVLKLPAAHIIYGGGLEKRLSEYKRLMDRQKADSDEVKKDKYIAKKKQRLE